MRHLIKNIVKLVSTSRMIFGDLIKAEFGHYGIAGLHAHPFVEKE